MGLNSLLDRQTELQNVSVRPVLCSVTLEQPLFYDHRRGGRHR